MGGFSCSNSSQAINEDIRSLGAASLHMAVLDDGLSGNIREKVAALPYSVMLKNLIIAMLTASDGGPTLEDIHNSAYICSQPRQLHVSNASVSSHLLPCLSKSKIKLFSFSTRLWTVSPLSCPIKVDGGSACIWANRDLFCSGGKATQAGLIAGKPTSC